MSTDWNSLRKSIDEALAEIGFLMGVWQGQGTSHGEPVSGRLTIRLIADGGFMEQREELLEGGAVVHEDLAIYRWDATNQSLRVQHFAPPGVVNDAYVLLDSERPGLRWVAGPGAARVEIWPESNVLHLHVFLPGSPEAVQKMRYTRLESR